MTDKEMGGGDKPKKRRAANYLTAAEWARIEQDAKQSEKKPDPAQISWLPPAPGATSG